VQLQPQRCWPWLRRAARNVRHVQGWPQQCVLQPRHAWWDATSCVHKLAADAHRVLVCGYCALIMTCMRSQAAPTHRCAGAA